MSKKIIKTDKSPAAVGPYSQAVLVDGWLYVSGQIPLDPASGEVVAGDIETRTRRVLDNLSAVLQAAGGGLKDVIRTTVFLENMGDFARVNAIYATYFADDPPARACVQVAALPKGVDVEIDAVAKIS
jgi:2-iminobutanoate/2-iminopropanoate deaminase